ncbi:MAG TPA: Uma2 family endonuclease [Pirellulales bacterium]|nr:Uma2 family endonuclease [Pirellulales bacterium]
MATVERQVSPEHRLLLRSVPWETYVGLRDLECNNHVFMTYDRGTLELMSPSGQHDNVKTLLGQLVEAFTTELNIPRRSFGSTTWRKRTGPDVYGRSIAGQRAGPAGPAVAGGHRDVCHSERLRPLRATAAARWAASTVGHDW